MVGPQGFLPCCQEPDYSSWGRRPLSIASLASSSGQGHLQLYHSAVLWMHSGITVRASLLAGGYERFSLEYPEFCAKTKSLSNVSPPISVEPLDLGCSSCGTPFHDQVCPKAQCLAILTTLPALQPALTVVSLLSLCWGLGSQTPAPSPLMGKHGDPCNPRVFVCPKEQTSSNPPTPYLPVSEQDGEGGRAEIGLAPQEGSLYTLF